MSKRLALAMLSVVLLDCRAPGLWAADGMTETILVLPAGNRPEGLAVHPVSGVFVGNRQTGGVLTANEILRIEPDGSSAVFATLPGTRPAAEGLLGLAVDAAGHVYAALVSFDGDHGIWRVSRDGSRTDLLPGSSAIGFPNALTFDRIGNLYVTDSFGGAVWRARPGESFTRWFEHELLAPLPFDPFGTPLPGANGIAFFPPDTLYVANTERGLLVKLRIEPDGGAGPAEAVTSAFAVPTIDGIAVDVRGQVYGVLPAFAILGVSPLVRIDPARGAVTPIVTDAVDASAFDTPLSLAFGSGRWGVKALLVTNGDLPVIPGGPGPGVIRVKVGVPGFPVH